MNDTELTTAELSTLLFKAKQAAIEVGDFLVQQIGQAKVQSQKSSRDDLLNVDLEAERIILTRLREISPEIGILSEETGLEENTDHYWIVDPLDGSANFQHGSPLFAVAIALIKNDTTILGIIYLPIKQEMFTAIRNQGAYLNDNRIEVSKIATLEKAMIHVGDIMKEGNSSITAGRLKDIAKLGMHVQRIRMIGTAATDLAYLASGRADALVNHARTPWDIEAGKLILLEAGGRMTSKERENNEVLSVYSNGAIHHEMESLLFS